LNFRGWRFFSDELFEAFEAFLTFDDFEIWIENVERKSFPKIDFPQILRQF
jgi:hypothetical protein